MADALISVVVELLAPFFRNKLKKEVRLVLGTPENVRELLDTFDQISYVLDDAEKKHIHNVLHNMEKGETKKAPESAWLEKLTDVSYQMEDVLDEWHTELMMIERGSPRSSIKKGTLHLNIGSRILELKQRLDRLLIEKDQLKIGSRRLEEDRRDTGSMIKLAEVCGRDLEKEKLENMLLSENSHVETRSGEGKQVHHEEGHRDTSSMIELSKVYGRDQEKTNLLNMLLSKSSNAEINIPVISIIGMGGIGKTTLAKCIFNDEMVKNHFEMKMWVCVSDPFDLTKIVKAIIEEAGDIVSNGTNTWNSLSRQLREAVGGKIFLLVLDDVWTKDPAEWEELKLALDSGKNGSIIVVTTREDAVADVVGTTASDKHMIGRLSDEDCWSLFERLAYKETEEFNCQNLKGIGRDISNKCKGVPLHAKILGSLMSTKKTTDEWEEVLRSDTWDSPFASKGVLPALLLSYYALPSHLKRCFTYCAVFAKDTQIWKGTLIKMWMAEGCLFSTKTSELEKTGEKYFTELVMRSFFQELQLDPYGDVCYCKMHDLLHDLATFLGNNKCQVVESKGIKLNNTKLRHLCVQISEDEMDGSLNSIWRLKPLRTFLLGGRRYADSSLQDWAQMRNLTCLRTLDLSHTSMTKLPKEVEKLIHLRYLNLSDTEIKELPETITNLINLQSLDLSWCSSLSGLPNSFGELVSLRHLDITLCDFTKGLPRGIGKLRDLRTLSNFIVSEEGCDLGELKYLNNLCGSLFINKIRGIGDEAQGVMNNQKYLHKLYLDFSFGSEDDDLKALELLEPHSDLKELEINSYRGSKFPSWMEFLGTRQKPIMLRLLTISQCYNLKVLPMGLGVSVEMSASNIAFPKLKELVIWEMNSWEEWVIHTTSMNITLMPCLQFLSLLNCPMLKLLPCQLLSSSSLRKLWIRDCPNLVISRLPFFLEELYLQSDAGSLSKSLPVEGGPHTNLKSLKIHESLHPILPEGVSQLTALQTLEIWRSPILAARCKKEEGEDWNIISHIPNIHIR